MRQKLTSVNKKKDRLIFKHNKIDPINTVVYKYKVFS